MTILVTGGAGYIGSHMVLELLDAGEKVVVLDNLSTGFRWAVPEAATLVVGDVGDQDLVRTLVKKHGINAIIHFAGSIVVPEFGRRSARLLQQQHRQVARPDRGRGRDRREELHLLVDGRRLRQSERDARQRGRRLEADVALRHLEAHDGADARRHVARPRFPLRRAALLQRRRRRPEGPHRPVDAARHPSHQGRLRDGARQAPAHGGLRHRLRDAGRHLHPRLHPRHRSRARPPRGACSPAKGRQPPTSSTAATRAAIPCSRSSTP